MHTVVNVLLGILGLIVVVWVVIFGGVGALLARARRGSAAAGFAWGALLGPIGWAAILWTTRAVRQSIDSSDWMSDDAIAPTPKHRQDEPHDNPDSEATGGHYF